MKRSAPITALFLDIGGVLLTDGWDHHARKRAAAHYKLELTELEDRHHLTFDTYEEGKLTLEEYLDRVVFHQKRPFWAGKIRRVAVGRVIRGAGRNCKCAASARSGAAGRRCWLRAE